MISLPIWAFVALALLAAVGSIAIACMLYAATFRVVGSIAGATLSAALKR